MPTVDWSRPVKRVALVVGNAAYPTAPLKNPVSDARMMAQQLRDLGFSVQELYDATQVQIKRAVAQFGKTLKASRGVGLFYFSGHGLQANGESYLVPIDAKLEDEAMVDAEAIDTDDVLAVMEAAQNDLNIVILDACRNNPFVRSSRSLSRGLAFINAPPGTLIAYATAPGSVASDGDGKNGTYTAALFHNIDQCGLDLEGVLKRTGAEVSEKTNGLQTPWYSSSFSGEFYFRPCVAPDAVITKAQAALQKGDCAGAARELAPTLASSNTKWESDEQNADAARLLDQALACSASYNLSSNPPGATFYVDGMTPIITDERLLLNLGKRDIEAHLAGYNALTRSFEVKDAGDHGDLKFELLPVDPIEKQRPSVWPWVLMASGGALGIGALATGIASHSAHTKLESNCQNGCPSTFDWQSEQSTGKALAVTSDVLLVTGIAAAGAGAVWYFLEHKHREKPINTAFGCSGRGCAGAITVRY